MKYQGISYYIYHAGHLRQNSGFPRKTLGAFKFTVVKAKSPKFKLTTPDASHTSSQDTCRSSCRRNWHKLTLWHRADVTGCKCAVVHFPGASGGLEHHDTFLTGFPGISGFLNIPHFEVYSGIILPSKTVCRRIKQRTTGSNKSRVMAVLTCTQEWCP